MAVNRNQHSRHGLLLGLLALQVSCSSIHSNVRQKQASDGLSGNGNLVLTAFRATAVAAIRQPVTTTKLGLAILWNRPREIVSGNAPIDPTPQPVLTSPGSPDFEDWGC